MPSVTWLYVATPTIQRRDIYNTKICFGVGAGLGWVRVGLGLGWVRVGLGWAG